ncbi:MAG: AI-2E family transporter, partial [Bradyrhizobium canariense]
MRVLPSERMTSGNGEGTPLPESHGELPPVIRRTEIVAFSLAGLLLIAVVAVLYVGRAFFLPVVMAFVIGT